MSFEDLEVARAARAAKETIKGKGKRGWKRKSAVLEAEEQDPDQGLARAVKEAIKGRGKRRRNRKSAAQDVDEPEPEAAQMIEAPWPQWRTWDEIIVQYCTKELYKRRTYIEPRYRHC